MSKDKTSVTLEEATAKLFAHVKNRSQREKAEEVLRSKSIYDPVFPRRTVQLVTIADSHGISIFDLFKEGNFQITNYFQNIPEGSRPGCHFCFEDDLKTGYTVEFFNDNYDLGPECLRSASHDFAPRREIVEKRMDEKKRQVFEKRNQQIENQVETFFQGTITIDDLTDEMRGKLIALNEKEEKEYQKFKEWQNEKQATLEEVREAYRQRFGRMMEKRLEILNRTPKSDMIQQLKKQFIHQRGKKDLFNTLLELPLDEDSRKIVEDIAETTETPSPEQFKKLRMVFELYYPRNVWASYSGIISDLEQRREQGAINDLIWKEIEPLLKKAKSAGGHFLTSGVEALKLRYADPEDIIKVRESTNSQLFKKGDFNPLKAFKRNLYDHYLHDFEVKSAKAKGEPVEDERLIEKDYSLLKFIHEVGGATGNTGVELNYKAFLRNLRTALSMKDYQEKIGLELKTLALKDQLQKRYPDKEILKQDYTLLENLAQVLPKNKVAAYAAELNLQTKNPAETARKVAEEIVDRVANTYFDEHNFTKFQRENRDDLVAAAKLGLIRADKDFVSRLLKYYEKVKDGEAFDIKDQLLLHGAAKINLVRGSLNLRDGTENYFQEFKYQKNAN